MDTSTIVRFVGEHQFAVAFVAGFLLCLMLATVLHVARSEN